MPQLATTWNGRRAAVSPFERRVYVWDLLDGTLVAEFDTVLDFGGRRLAITADGKYVVAAAYRRHGVACYLADTGAMIWQRKDLKKAQYVTIDQRGGTLFVGMEGRGAHALRLRSGVDLGSETAVYRVAESPFPRTRLLDRNHRSAVLVHDKSQREIELTTSAFLDFAFSPTALLTSDMGGPVRCFRLADAQERWRVEWRAGTHALRLCYVPKLASFLAVVWCYQRGGNSVLVRLDVDRGRILQRSALPCGCDFEFCALGTRILTCEGSVICTSTGEVQSRLPFSTAFAEGTEQY